MERVKKGEKYYYIDSEDVITLTLDDYTAIDNIHYNLGNYFSSTEEAEAMAEKIRKVLKGAEVIEMPSEDEIRKYIDNYTWYPVTSRKAIDWLKSKIVK